MYVILQLRDKSLYTTTEVYVVLLPLYNYVMKVFNRCIYRKHGLAYVFTRDFWLYDFKKDLQNMGKNLEKSCKIYQKRGNSLEF